MKTALFLLLALPALSCAQDKKPEVKRLSAVTWDLKSHKLIWEVQSGKTVNGEFVPKSSEKYEIRPENAMMTFLDERRTFLPEEAAALQRLLDTLSLYCAESVIWWDQGQGTPVDEKAQPVPSRSKPPAEDPNRRKVESRPLKTADTLRASK